MSRISDLVSITTPSSSMVLVVSDGQLSRKVTVADFKNTIFTKASTTSLGVIKVGNGLDIDDTGVLSVKNFNTYVLPVATQSLLGGIRVGSGLSITVDGLLSANYSGLPVASSSTLGGVKVNNSIPGLSVNGQGLLSVSFPTSYNTLTFLDPGLTVGNDSDLRIYVANSNVPTIQNQVGGLLRFTIKDGNISPSVELTSSGLTGNNAALLPNSNEVIDLGSSAFRWGTIYANSFIGSFDGIAANSDLLRVEGTSNALSYQYATVPVVSNKIVARDGEGKIFATSFIGNLSGTADRANLIKISANDYGAVSVDVANAGTPLTVPVRNSSGEINASRFNGPATVAETLKLSTNTFVSASITSVINSIPVRDNIGDIYASKFVGNLNGVADKADQLKVDTGVYFTTNQLPVANSIPIRDPFGSIYANSFIGIATQAELLRVGNIDYPGAYSAIANTVVIRNSSGAIAATQATFNNIVKSGNNSVGDIGQTDNKFNNVYAVKFNGTATSAQFADLAEKYESDNIYDEGTVVIFGGEKEITQSTIFKDPRVAGVISSKPAYLMNSESSGQMVALRGKVPVKVLGAVSKGDLLVTSGVPGHAISCKSDVSAGAAIFAKSIEDKRTSGYGTVMAVIL